MAAKFCLFGLAILYICVTQQNVLASLQQITFFEDFGCSGRNETVTDTRDDLDTFWATNASSALIVGLWKIHLDKQISNTSWEGVTILHHDTKPPGGKCVNKTEWPVDSHKLIYTERLGPSDMTSSQIVFCTEDDFTGLHYATNDSVEQLPPRPFAMGSVLHFSGDTWTAYSNKTFTGNETQFLASGTVGDQADNFSFNYSMTLVVGSVKKSTGCSIISSGATVTLFLIFTSIANMHT